MAYPNKLLIATTNAGKVAELTELLADLPVRLHSLSDFPNIEDVEETGATFAENAALKARHYAAQSRLLTLADDSGLEVEALGGRPGIFSARYAGPDASDAERIRRLLAELKESGDENRRARFVCVIAVVDWRDTQAQTFEGVCAGHIADAPRGAGGFGYDPVFIPEGHSQSFGELSAQVKQQISHRARALARAELYLRSLFH